MNELSCIIRAGRKCRLEPLIGFRLLTILLLRVHLLRESTEASLLFLMQTFQES